MPDIPDHWRRDGDALVRDLELDDFAAALACVNRAGELAEEANHHPDLLIHGYNKLRVTLTTHSEGGLSEADYALARRLNAVLPSPASP